MGPQPFRYSFRLSLSTLLLPHWTLLGLFLFLFWFWFLRGAELVVASGTLRFAAPSGLLGLGPALIALFSAELSSICTIFSRARPHQSSEHVFFSLITARSYYGPLFVYVYCLCFPTRMQAL